MGERNFVFIFIIIKDIKMNLENRENFLNKLVVKMGCECKFVLD